MLLNDFDYELPTKLIAQTPSEKRDCSRLLVYSKQNKKIIHSSFSNITDFLKPDDVLVVNNSKVIPARIIFYDNDREHEIFLVRKTDENEYDCIVRPGKKFRTGSSLRITDSLKCEIKNISSIGRIIKFFSMNDSAVDNHLNLIGQVPLPPYIKNFKGDTRRYQTVYSKIEGSSAAPTAGLHFTDKLIQELKKKITDFIQITLHVGPGTFQPVKTENIKEHKMHSEYYSMEPETFEKLKKYKKEKKNIIAVGTTSVRTLESVFSGKPLNGETDIFIYPGYKFKAVDGIITNFHLPKSTLLMLVSAFSSVEEIKKIYAEAVAEKYRFFSFGDAMLLR